jgi:hypothetical protein
MDSETMFRLFALERMVTWLAAQEVKRSGDVSLGLQTMSNSLHDLLDKHQSEDFPGAQAMKEQVSIRLDGLVQAVEHEVGRDHD